MSSRPFLLGFVVAALSAGVASAQFTPVPVPVPMPAPPTPPEAVTTVTAAPGTIRALAERIARDPPTWPASGCSRRRSPTRWT